MYPCQSWLFRFYYMSATLCLATKIVAFLLNGMRPYYSCDFISQMHCKTLLYFCWANYQWSQCSHGKVSQIPFQSTLLISQIWNVALSAFWGTLWGKILVAHITFTFCSFHCWCSVKSIEIEEVIPKGGVYVQSDGEHLGFLPTECSVLPAAINIFSWHWALLSSGWIK